MNYTEILGGMRRYYGEGRTQSFEGRRKSLEKLEQGLKRWGSRLEQALLLALLLSGVDGATDSILA